MENRRKGVDSKREMGRNLSRARKEVATKTVKQTQKQLRRKKRTAPAKLDELGIERGQNAEKGITVEPQNLRDADEAAH